MAIKQHLDFGDLLRLQRKQAGLTQEELAERSGLSVRAISDLERGVKHTPRKDTLHLLFTALGLTPGEEGLLISAARRIAQGSRPEIDGAITLEEPDPRIAKGMPAVGGFLGAIPTGPLVAREAEVQSILERVEAIRQGAGRLIFVAGPAGIGKTRLAQEVFLQLRKHGHLVATGVCYANRLPVPYFPFLEALEQLFECASESVRNLIPQQWPYLARLLPGYSDSTAESLTSTGDDQLRLFRSVAGFVQTLAACTPVAILLDDMQWADVASLQLLHHLARHTRDQSVLLLATYRVEDEQQQLARLVLNLTREGLVESVQLQQFDMEGTRAMVSAALGDSHAAGTVSPLIHRHTEGNPFYIQEVLRALAERGDIYRSARQWMVNEDIEIQVPKTVRATLQERFDRISAPTRNVLMEASVFGQAFLFSELQALTERTEEDLEAALDEALGATLIKEGELDTYTFSHALIQQTLYDVLSRHRKQRLHRAVGNVLEKLPEHKRGERAATLAWHYRRGGDHQRAVTFSLLAGEEAERVFAHNEAANHYWLALELARESDEAAKEAEASEKLARVLMIQARYDVALDLLIQAAHRYRELRQLDAEERVVAQIGRVHSDRGSSDEGIAHLEDALRRLETTTPTSGLAEILVALARLYFYRGRYVDSLRAAERASAVSRSVDDAVRLAEAESRRSSALQLVGRLEEAIAMSDDTVKLVEATENIEMLCRVLHTAATGYLFSGSIEKSKTYLERAHTLAGRSGYRGIIALTEPFLCDAHFHLGDWERARELGEQAVGATADFSSWYAGHSLTSLGRLHLARGDWEDASRYLEKAVLTAEQSGNDIALAWAQVALGERDILAGHPSAAIHRLRNMQMFHGAYMASVLTVQAWGHLEMGSVQVAQEIALGAVTRTRADGTKLLLVDALRVLGMVYARRADWEEAERQFDEALSLARDMTYPYAHGRILLERGLVFSRRGRVDLAREPIEEALGIFRRLGAKKETGRADQLLASLY